MPHVYGHNPYVEEYDPFEFTTEFSGPYMGDFTGDVGEWSLSHYGYQGMTPEIMDALQSIFGAHEGQIFDVSNTGYQPFGDIFSDAHMTWTDDGFYMDIPSFNEDELAEQYPHFSMAEDAAQVVEEAEHAIEGGEGYDPSMGVLPFVNIFDPASLAAGLSSMSGYDYSIRPGEVRALTPEMIEKTESQYYDPYEQAKRATLVEKKAEALGKPSTGGFAGSAGRQSTLSGAEQLWRGGYQDLLSQIMQFQGDALGDVMENVYSWQELISDVETQ